MRSRESRQIKKFQQLGWHSEARLGRVKYIIEKARDDADRLGRTPVSHRMNRIKTGQKAVVLRGFYWWRVRGDDFGLIWIERIEVVP